MKTQKTAKVSIATQIANALQAKQVEITMDADWFAYSLKGVWHWFEIWEDGSLFFNHSYSQNTGASYKSIGHKMRIYNTVQRLTGINPQG